MRLSALFTILAAISLLPQFFRAEAQTYRVSAGFTPDGCACFMEVFEYDYVTEKPSFPGGDDKMLTFINSHREYPPEAYKRGIQGRVTCSFVVNIDGSISHVTILRGVERSLNREALRLISSMPDWQPGKINGMPVPTRVIRSVPFRR